MQLGLSLDALKEKRAAKSADKKRKNREKLEQRRSKAAKEEEASSAQEDSSNEESEDEKKKPERKSKKRLNREERMLLLETAVARSKEDIEGITEEEQKQILRKTVDLLNTIPYEPVKIMNFPPDRDPHKYAKNRDDRGAEGFSKRPEGKEQAGKSFRGKKTQRDARQ